MKRGHFRFLVSVIASTTACGDGVTCSEASSKDLAKSDGSTMSGATSAANATNDGSETIETFALVSDDSWLTYGTAMNEDPPAGWNTVDFDDRAWSPSVAPNPAACNSYEPTQSWERPNQPM